MRDPMFIFPTLLCAALLCKAHAQSGEQRLTQKLLTNYVKTARPVLDDADVVNLTLGIGFNQVIDINEPLQTMTSIVWLRLYWIDEYMKWNESEYNNLSSINLNPKQIWLPDLTLYTLAQADPFVFEKPANVYSNGLVVMLQPVFVTTYCQIHPYMFPYDVQVCPLQFGSWTYHNGQLRLIKRLENADLSNYIVNGEWNVEHAPAVLTKLKYPCCDELYPDITYHIVLQRRPLFYMFNLFLPFVLFEILSLFTFLMPVESGEKMSMVVTLLLSLAVFMILVADYFPPTSLVVPLICLYFTCSIMLLALMVVGVALVLIAHHSGVTGKKVPKIFNWITKPKKKTDGETLVMQVKPVSNGNEKSNSKASKKNGTAAVLEQPWDATVDEEQDLVLSNAEAWFAVARWLDRLFLYVFTALSIIVNVAIIAAFYNTQDGEVKEMLESLNVEL